MFNQERQPSWPFPQKLLSSSSAMQTSQPIQPLANRIDQTTELNNQHCGLTVQSRIESVSAARDRLMAL